MSFYLRHRSVHIAGFKGAEVVVFACFASPRQSDHASSSGSDLLCVNPARFFSVCTGLVPEGLGRRFVSSAVFKFGSPGKPVCQCATALPHAGHLSLCCYGMHTSASELATPVTLFQGRHVAPTYECQFDISVRRPAA